MKRIVKRMKKNNFYDIFDKKSRLLGERYIKFVHKRVWSVLAGFLLSSLFFLYIGSGLQLKTDFADLLPDHYISVSLLKNYIDRMGGLNRLLVAVESDDFISGRKFVDDLVSEINKYPEKTVRYVDYNINAIKDYYESNFLHYMEEDDLKDLHSRLAKKIAYEKKKNSPFNLKLLGEDYGLNKEEGDFDISDLKKKYESKYSNNGGKNSKIDDYIEGYYTNKQGTLIVVGIAPYGSSLSFKQAEKFNAMVEGTINKLNPSSYSKNMKVGLAGNMKSRLEEHQSIREDLASTTLLVFSLVGLSIFIFFWNISSIILLITNLVLAICWSMGITYFYFGSLNSQTAFLVSIIVGTGVNYGIIYLFRYLEEIENGHDSLKANILAIQNTYLPTMMAVVTTFISFASLSFAENNGFSQFGFIGSAGVLITWVFTMTLLPALIFILDKVPFLRIKPRKIRTNHGISNVISWINNRMSRPIAIFTITFFIVGMAFFINYIPNSLEYDLSKLRSKKILESSTRSLTDKIEKVFPESLTPSIILTDSIDESREVCEVLEKKKEEDPTGPARTIGNCYDITKVMPGYESSGKVKWISKIKKELYDDAIKWLNDEDYDRVINTRSNIKTRELTLEDLPEDVSKHFRELNKNIGTVVYIEQHEDYGLIKRDNLMDYSSMLREIKLGSGKVIRSSGEWIIFADLLESIKSDMPIVSIIAFLSICMAVFLLMGDARSFFVVMCSLMIGVGCMLGIMGVFDIKLNFFNFIAIPITLGLAVDYPINVYSRYRIDGFKNFDKVILNTGAPVLLCSITTQVSYLILSLANNQALASFGFLSLIGELTCIFSALFMVPVFHNMINKKRS